MNPIKLYMYKDGTELKWRPYQFPKYQAWVWGLKDDDTVQVTFKLNKPSKTIRQLGYYHAVLLPHAASALLNLGHDTLFNIDLGDLSTGVETNEETVDIFLKTLFKMHKGLDKLPLKRNMNVDEMGQLIDFAINWIAVSLGVYVPTPDDKE